MMKATTKDHTNQKMRFNMLHWLFEHRSPEADHSETIAYVKAEIQQLKARINDLKGNTADQETLKPVPNH